MALVLADRVKETTTTTGTATYTLAGASTGFESFASIGDGNTTYYACTDGTDFEVGIGTYTASGTTLARTTILQSSNSDAAVSWSSGTKTIFCCQPAEKAVFLDASGNIAAFNGSNLTNVNATTLDNLDSTQFLRSDAADTKTSGNLTFSDNVQLRAGDGGDLQIYHDGSNSIIFGTTGSTFVQQNGFGYVGIQGKNGVDGIRVNSDDSGGGGNVELYHVGSKKLETTSTGTTVTGVLTADGIDVGDNEPIRVGASQDLTISHDGSNSRIKDVGTGSLLIGASFVGIQKADGSETAAKFFNDGAVELYHDNSKKLETTSSGATVTGVLTSDGVDVGDSERIRLGASQDLQIYHDGSNSYISETGTGHLIINSTGSNLYLRTNTTENSIVGINNGAVELYHDNSKKIETTSTGANIEGDLTIDLGGGAVEHKFTSWSAADTDIDGLIGGSTFGALYKVREAGHLVIALEDNDTNDSVSIVSGGGNYTTDTTYDTLIANFSAGGNTTLKYLYADQINLGDNERIRLGASQDLQIYHDGSNSYIDNTTGHTYIRDNGFGSITLQPTSGENSGVFNANGSVELYYDNIKKLETTSSGATVTGVLTADGVDVGDNERIRLGASPTSDLQIWHDGSNSNIVNGTGSLIIADTSGDVKIQGKYGEQSIVANNDGSVELYYDNSKKLETTADGASITGDLTLTSTDAGATENPTLDLYRNSASPADQDIIGHINFSGENDAGEKIVYGEIQTKIRDVTDGTENGAIETYVETNGSLDLYTVHQDGESQFYKDVQIISNDSGSTENPTLQLYRNSSSPANGDDIGHITFSGENSAGEKIIYGEIESKTLDVTDGTEDGLIQFRVASEGTIGSSRLQLSGNGRTTFFGKDVQLGSGLNLIFEGATDDANETTLTVVDPTSDNTIQLPDSSGTVALQEQAYQAINAQTGTTYTTVLADGGKLVTLSNASAITLTIPPNSSVAYPVGTKLDFIQIGAGQVTVAGGTGVTVNSTPTLKFRAQHSGASCIKIATDTWQLVGDLAES